MFYYVYILKSSKDPSKLYVGQTNDPDRRLREHNTRPSCSYTDAYRPWSVVTIIRLEDRRRAGELERYLKSHSGRVFLRKRLI